MQRKNSQPIEAPKLNKLSQAVLAALGALSIAPSLAGPGMVTDSTGSFPTYYANSPQLRKFVDPLPGLGATDPTKHFANGDASQYIPVAVADTTTYPGSEYFVMGVVEYSQRMHSDLAKPTTLRGYVQLYPQGSTHPATAVALYYPKADGTPDKTKPIYWPGTLNAEQVYAYDNPHYLGPIILTPKGTPVRMTMMNFLPTGRAVKDVNGNVITRNGDHFLPVDESLPGAGNTTFTAETFPQNRVAIHLHGGDSPWISDGTPHQWFAAVGEKTNFPKGDRLTNVPDMPDPGLGGVTIFWPNDQSARLMWYHDHTFGLTRQNAYAGMAAGYLITDSAENLALGLNADGTANTGSAVPADMIPLIIQDKTFVPGDIAKQDAKWDQNAWGKPGDLWFPHVYEPFVVNSRVPDFSKLTGDMLNPAGRWDYGPTLAAPAGPIPAILDLPDGRYGHASTTPEAYMDTPVINGVAYPRLEVEPKAYRVRFLNGANDRYFNLSLWIAKDMTNGGGDITKGGLAANTEVDLQANPGSINSIKLDPAYSGQYYSTAKVDITDFGGGPGLGAKASIVIDSKGALTGFRVDNPGFGYLNPKVTITDTAATPAAVTLSNSMAVSFLNHGAGYTKPVVSISDLAADGVTQGPGTGMVATATVDPTSGAITNITFGLDTNLTNPTPYNNPQITITESSNTTPTTVASAIIVNNITAIIGTKGTSGSGYHHPLVTISDAAGGSGKGATATAQVDATGAITGITVTQGNSWYTNPQITITDQLATATAVVNLFEAVNNPGPAIIQIGNETGLLPKPVVHQPQVMQYNQDGTEVLGGGGFYLGGAERGDTVIDFSQYAGKTLILYNDSSAPVPGGDPRYDYYTGNPDLSFMGGAPSTLAGYGPNTRTLMQIKVAPATVNAPSYKLDAVKKDGSIDTVNLETAVSAAYQKAAEPHIVSPGTAPLMPNVTDVSSLTFNPAVKQADGTTVDQLTLPDGKTTVQLKHKTIEGTNDSTFGRLIANFGFRVPGQANITPLAYIDSATDIVNDGETQYWVIENRDADNHPIHFHLFNVQVLARYDGSLTTANKLIPPTADEAGWKETVQNWPLQSVIVALKPKTPALPFGLPNSVRLMDPTLAQGDKENTSLFTKGSGNGTTIPWAFQQFDLITGAAKTVVNDFQDYGWEYVYHCHILGHEENDLMRPMIFNPTPVVTPTAPSFVNVNATTGTVTWTDATPTNGTAYNIATGANGMTKSGNPANEIGFRVEYAERLNGVTQAFHAATPKSAASFVKIPDTTPASLKSEIFGKINAIANSGSFDTDIAALAATKPNTDLVYRVVAVNQKGEAASSESATIGQLPAAPSNVVVLNTAPGSISVTWTDNATNEEGYVVEYRLSGSKDPWTSGPKTGTITPSAPLAPVTVSNLTPGKQYEIQVGAIRTGFPTKYSSPATTMPIQLSLPTGLTAVFNAALKSVTLNWTDTSVGEGNYVVQRAIGTVNQTTGAVTWSAATSLPALNSTLLPDLNTYTNFGTGVVANTLYQYRVGAISPGSIGPVATANVITATTLAGVSQMQATGVNTASAISFQWQQSTSALVTGYEIMRCKGTKAACGLANAAWVPAGVVSGLINTKFTDSGLTSKTAYSYKLRAVNSAVTTPISTWSAIYSSTTL